MEYKFITKESERDLNIANEPFDIYGKMNVTFTNKQWDYTQELFDSVSQLTFPAENYQFENIEKNGFAIGAYDNNTCIGLAIFEFNWNKYLYLSDLKVNKNYRRQGVAQKFIELGLAKATENNYAGIYTIGQDNNLAACLFYLKQGFLIGGFNNRDYQHTQQEGKADIYFYLDN